MPSEIEAPNIILHDNHENDLRGIIKRTRELASQTESFAAGSYLLRGHTPDSDFFICKIRRTAAISPTSVSYNDDQMIKSFVNSQTILPVEIKTEEIHEHKNMHMSTGTDMLKRSDL